MQKSVRREIFHWDSASLSTTTHDLISEEPLSIRIDGKPYMVILRTPGEEREHAAGICLAEGILDSPNDAESITICEGPDSNVVTITLTKGRREKISGFLDRRFFISQTGCGVCGKEVVEDLFQNIQPLEEKRVRIEVRAAMNAINELSMHQPLREETRSSHAAAVFDSGFRLLSVAEDVGRHNALDKAIGNLFLKDELKYASFVLLSSRVSYELVQKAARARIPVILSVSRPTALSVELASKLNMTLACLSEVDGLYIFCGEHRLYVEWDSA